MNQEERKKYILERLKISSSVSVSELSEAFGLSEVSVRKLLSGMEQEGVLKRTWGGAVSAYGSLREFSHQENENRHRWSGTAATGKQAAAKRYPLDEWKKRTAC